MLIVFTIALYAILFSIVLILLLLLVDFKTSFDVRPAIICCIEFAGDMGPNISAVSIVAIFIPVQVVDDLILFVVFGIGIMLKAIAVYVLKRNRNVNR